MTELLNTCITEDLAGVGGLCRAQTDDFYVEEIPLYPPSGSGVHTLFEIEKRDLDTPGAIRLLARDLGVPSRFIGCAGLKDAHAVSRQRLSVEGVAPDCVMAIQYPQLKVLWAERHRNRLKIGHLRGNRFIIRIRQVVPDSLERARPILAMLTRRGLPNGFGLQRFGSRGQTHLLGRCLVLHDLDAFFKIYLGSPQPDDASEARTARELYDAGDLPGALRLWPNPYSDEFRTLSTLSRHKSLNTAYYRLPRELLRLSIAAYQAYLFNHLLEQRLPTFSYLQDGDLAYKHDNGVCFLVENAAAEQPRADRLEISPSAPLFGRKVRLASGIPGECERSLLSGEGLTLENLHPLTSALDGARRSLRVPLGEVDLSQDQDGLVIKFTLPPGAYATNLLRELMKTPDVR